MENVFVWTLHDVVGLGLIIIISLICLGIWAYWTIVGFIKTLKQKKQKSK